MPPLDDLDDLDGLVGVREDARRFQTVYVDTRDLRLARWGCSLRHRGGEGWTVKLPPTMAGVLLVRGEHVFPGEANRVPAAAADLLAAFVRGAELVPVVRLRTIRRRIELRDVEGTPVGEVVDDEVSIMDGARVAGRFREVEVEVGPTVPEEALGAVLGRLREAGAAPTDGTPKYLRALGARASEPPELVVPDLPPNATVADVVGGALTSSVVRLLTHDAGVRLGEDPEDVHQARVATRRLRSDLRTFRDLLDPEWDASLREELGWLGGELGAVRDTDVQLMRMRGRIELLPAEDRPDGERLLGDLEARRTAAREELLREIRIPRYTALLDRLVEAAREPAILPEVAGEPAGKVLGALMERPWKHLKSTAGPLGRGAADEELHLVRIRAKRARYAAEALAPVFGKPAHAFAEAAIALQDILGEHQDAVVARTWLREASRGSRRLSFVAGELTTIEASAAEDARRRWPKAWKRLSRKRLRFWA